MQTHEWQRWGIVATLIWPLPAATGGMFLAVAPATSAYQSCLKSHDVDRGDCQCNLRSDWTKYSGDRLTYAALVGLGPIPIVWLIALGLSAALQQRGRSGVPGQRSNARKTVERPGYLLRGETAL
jgi:uncharacterized membrane protein YesL